VPLDDELINKVTWKIPNALVLIGSRSGDERNAMTASWVTQLSMEPVLVGVGIDNDETHRLIARWTFTVNLGTPRTCVREVLEARDDDGDSERPPGAATTAPVFSRRLPDGLPGASYADLGTHTLFVVRWSTPHPR
jgi:hypothetical protein